TNIVRGQGARIGLFGKAMDYDQTKIAASYERARALTPEAMSLWKRLLTLDVERGAVSRAVDLGCGTGRFSGLLAAEFNCPVVGVDPSKTMLAEARRKPISHKVYYVEGTGDALPIADRSVDLVFMSMVYHHFVDPAAVARECRRVLGSGGYVCVRNSTR